MDLANAFRQASIIGVLPDAIYLQVRGAAMRRVAGSLALYTDLVDDLFTGVRQHFETYHGVQVSAEEWKIATEEALRVVDEQYLQEQWERGQPKLAVNDAAASQWEAALWWEIEARLMAILPEGRAQQQQPGFPGPEWGGRIEREWHGLSQFPNWYWGFTVRPRIPTANLVAFVRRHWRKVSDAPETYKAQVVREILDYCALWGHASPGNKGWREELREALWECHAPLRRALLRRESADYRRGTPKSPTATSEQALEHHFRQALQEWEPFHGSPDEPPVPVGLLGARVGAKPLPPEVYGRGVPFTHFLNRWLRKLPGDTRSFEFLRPDFDRTGSANSSDSDEGDEGLAKEEAGATPVPDEGWARFIITDDAGGKWLPLKGGLEEKASVPYKQLLGEWHRGFLKPQRLRRRLVVPVDDQLDDLCSELFRRSVLRHLKHFARKSGVLSDELRRIVTSRQHF